MAEPQGGILPEPAANGLFLVLRVVAPERNGRKVARAVAGFPTLVEKVAATLDRSARLTCTVSFGPDYWDLISPRSRPQGLRAFRALRAGGRSAPATGGDLLLHIVSRRHDVNFDLAMRLRGELQGRVAVVDEVHGFRYLDSRDLTGFVDGTESPKGRERARAALVGDEDRAFAGGSYVFTQRYVHDLMRWAALPVREQEAIVGRRKKDSRELTGRARLKTSHVSRALVEEDGAELAIVRHSFPYGTTSEAGLFFIAYARSPEIPERMLARMMGMAGDGLQDRLLEFSRAVTGANFFAPSLKVLRSFD